MKWRVTNEVPGVVILEIDTETDVTTAAMTPDQADAMASALTDLAREARAQ